MVQTMSTDPAQYCVWSLALNNMVKYNLHAIYPEINGNSPNNIIKKSIICAE